MAPDGSDEVKMRNQDFAEEKLARAVEAGASKLVSELHRRALSMLDEHRKLRAGFESGLAERWKPAFVLFEMILVSAQESVEEFDHKNRGEAAASNDLIFEALCLLSVRACRTASEALCFTSQRTRRRRTGTMANDIRTCGRCGFYFQKHTAHGRGVSGSSVHRKRQSRQGIPASLPQAQRAASER